MKVLLSHGYFLSEDEKERQIMRPYPPLGILYLSAYLERYEVDNEVFDTTFATLSELQNYLLTYQPDVVALYVNLMTKVNILKIVRFVKEQGSLSKTKIILGGPEVKNHAENFLKFGADYLVIGEGEETFYALIEYLSQKGELKLEEIAGIAYLDEAKATIFTPERTKIKNIDDFVPNRKKINLHLYLQAWKQHHGENAISVSTMRGCPYTCKWCSRAVYGLSYRRRSAKKVVEELQEIQTTYAPDTLWFVDDVFTISHKWLREFADELKANNLKVKYECITRADRMNEEVIQLLKETGCFRVWIGAESGSQKVIDLMDRRVDVNQVREMIQLSQKMGIQAGTFIMLGYPQETEEDIMETVHHLKVSNPDYFTITVAYPIKGTELYTEIEPTKVHSLPWENSSDRDTDFQRTYSRKYYDFAVRYVVNEVNLHKKKLKQEDFTMSAMKLKINSLAARIGMTLYK
ncbi:MAG: B12-binding domain-containing radical SAM protein [Bacteroidia bacterium]